MKKLVKNVEKMRKVLGKPKKEISKITGVKKETYQRWLDGESDPVGKYSKHLENTKKELEEEINEKGIPQEAVNAEEVSEENSSEGEEDKGDDVCILTMKRYFGYYKTGCGRNLTNLSDVKEFNYCPYCGKKIKIDK